MAEEKEEVQETSMEMFLITDFNIIKKLFSFVSFPSRTVVYQMPDKADKYVDGSVDAAAKLMNTLLEYQRDEKWRVGEYVHTSDFDVVQEKLFEDKDPVDVIGINLMNRQNNQPFTFGISGIKEAIVVPDLHSIVIVPDEPLVGHVAPNVIVRFVGLIQQKFFKCVLIGEDDPEHEGQRTLTMKYDPIEPAKN